MKKWVLGLPLSALIFVSGCALLEEDKRREAEMVKNTFVCEYDGGRLLARFDRDEIRVLLPDGSRAYLYRAASSSGTAYYTNGEYALLGKATNITFGLVGNLQALDCKPYDAKDKDALKEDKKNLKEF